MPTWAATLLVGCATVAANALLTAYYYGRLSERVDGHSRSIEQIEDNDNRQWDRINATAGGLEKVKGKLGINGG